MVKFTGFRIAAPSIRSFTLVCFSGLGLFACGKVLGADFNAAPYPTAPPSKGGGLTSVGGADEPVGTVTAGDDGFRSSSTAIEPGGTEAGGGQGDGGDADAEVAVSAGGAPNSDASTMDGSSGADAYGGTAGGGGEIAEPARCNPRAPFASVEKVHGISGAAALAHYSDNELTVYYAAPSDSGLSIVQATRPAIEDAFGTAELVAPLNQLGFVASPSLTADGLTVYVESNATGPSRIYSATRDAPDAEFPVPTMVSEIIAEVGVEGGPSISASGDDLYFHSTRNGNSELFRATRNAFGFQVAEELPVSSDDYLESFPVISPDDLTLYFLRRHVLDSPSSNTTLWRSIRANVSESFSDAEPVSELDSPEVPLVEFADWVSTDNCRFYFSRMPANETWTSSALYVATRAPEGP